MKAPRSASSSLSQGLTRKVYQTARGLGSGSIKSEPTGNTRQYTKSSSTKMTANGKWNIDYGDTIPNGQIDDFTGFGRKK